MAENKVREKKVKEKKASVVTKELFLIVVLLGLVFFLIVYFGVYMNLSSKAEQLESSNKTLKKEVEELKVHFDNMNKYQKETKEAREAILALCDRYPADARTEDALMLAVSMQENSRLNFSSITLTDTQYIHGVPVETVEKGGLQELTGEIVFASREVSYMNDTNYTNMKECIRSIYNYAENSDSCIGIKNIHYTLNEGSMSLEGVIDADFYSIQGTGKEYRAPEIGEYISGKENLFELFH